MSTCLNYVVKAIKQNKRASYITAVTCIDLTNAYNAVKNGHLGADYARTAISVRSYNMSYVFFEKQENRNDKKC